MLQLKHRIHSTLATFGLLGSTAIVANRRAIWQLVGGVNLYDGGSDGVATTTANNTLFASGGLFFPQVTGDWLPGG